VSKDDDAPIYRSEITASGKNFDYEREGAIYLINEKDDNGGNFGAVSLMHVPFAVSRLTLAFITDI
jgi:hypothetical protein